ncbi:helix-turn-helix domain-containing protein [Deinococcus peraridilitoris]|uniref:HTH cro/C1-type domain-containing protein n=1 Tax=Deinococcus peraridilitoris (strain DSM 19664 / LMG 22246 / CIP 109416 / KR-200) TaxID=937777 RepID=K9ZZE1_DEIPD|nr:helix-turn-helix transcriptional regulator [Deinococcus peraridilitoris]AFZ66100.1 hypothetical protein Deipe_0504 [Deinococcus peraridilitoris DSM 19664]
MIPTLSPFPGIPMAEARDKDGVLDAREAGKFLRDRLQDKGWQIQQLAERTTVPDPDYLSNLLSGRINAAKSKHLKSIAQALDLNAEDIRYLNPNLVVDIAPPQGRKMLYPIPEALQDAIDRYSERAPDLLKPKWQQYLASMRFRGSRPQTAEDWYDIYRDFTRHGIEPEGN